jgi:7-cyano-7-deazaguanine synthase
LKKAIVLLSGGLDSATAAAVAKEEGHDLYGLTIRYGQRHERELEAAKAIGKALGLKDHIFTELGLGQKGSALTDPDGPIPTDRDLEDIKGGGIPETYVPARNLLFLAMATHWAEVLGAEAIFTGFNAVDYSGYPDCSTDFVESFKRTIQVGTKAGRAERAPEIRAPLIDLTKADIIRLGNKLKVPFELTWSCYMGKDKACGHCDSCILRLRGFEEAGLKDPIEYQD